MQTLNYAFRIIQLLITIGVVSVAGLLMLTALPVRGNFKVLSVLSGSMVPTIPVGGAVIVKPADRYATDEIITFTVNGNQEQTITHRVVAVVQKDGQKQYRTKGDANEEIDTWSVTPGQIKGKVLFTFPYAGYIANWVKQPVGFVVLIILPAAILIYGELMSIKNEAVKWWKNKYLVLGFWFLILGGGFWANQNQESNFTQAWVVDREVSTANVIGVATCFQNCGQVTTTGDLTLTPTPTPTPNLANHLVINEILYDTNNTQNINGQGGSNRGEWLEIYNPTGGSVDLTNWTVEDNQGVSDAETLSGILPAGGYLILTGATESEFEVIWTVPANVIYNQADNGTIGNGFANDGDLAKLKDNSGNTVDQISWGNDTTVLNPSPPDVASGHSLERGPDGIDTNTAADFIDRSTPMPGS